MPRRRRPASFNDCSFQRYLDKLFDGLVGDVREDALLMALRHLQKRLFEIQEAPNSDESDDEDLV